jgi:hypothetical protein
MLDAETLEALRDFPDRLERSFAVVPQPLRHWAPASWDGVPSEALTAVEQVCHVRDIENEGYQIRFRRLLQEDDPLLASLDGYALAQQLGYAQSDPAEALAVFRSARLRTLGLLQEFKPSQWQRRGRFEGTPVTILGLAHLLCSHDQQHLAGLQWLLARMSSL